MRIPSLWAGTADAGGPGINGDLIQAAAVIADKSGAHDPSAKLAAYQTAASYWRNPGNSAADRALLVSAVTRSPFAQEVQATLDKFSKAAWAGQGTTDSARRQKMLDAFEALPGFDKKVVAGAQVDGQGRPSFASPDEFKANLQAQVDVAKIVDRAKAEGTFAEGQDPAVIADSTLSQAVKFAATVHRPRNDWTIAVQAFLATAPKDVVSLSPEAKAALAKGEAPAPSANDAAPEGAPAEVATALKAYRKLA